jgi:hypothetical protein
MSSFLLRSSPIEGEDAAWRRGERWLRRGIRDSSGFNETVGEAKTAHEIIAGLPAREFEALARAVRDAGAESELEFAVFVTVNRPMRSLCFEPEDLRYCSGLGLSIGVSAYAAAEA